MIQEQARSDTAPSPDPWSGWAKLVDLPASVADPEPPPPVEIAPTSPPAPPPAPPPTPQVPTAVPNDDLVKAVAQLAAELADERRRRAAAEAARREADARLHAAEVDAARGDAEVSTARGRIAELERDRDEVIRRAEELLTAVRERADQRLAGELDTANRHWSELLAHERSRVEALEREQAAITARVHDAWLAAAVLRRSRPLRPRTGTPMTPEEAEAEALEALEEQEPDPTLVAESPELAEEIENLRQRLRGRVRKPADIDTVEEGVDQLREARLAREAAGKGRRRK